MTETSDARRSRWRRLLASTRGRVEVVALSLVLILCGAVAFAVVPAVASDEKLVGKPVPDGDVPAIVATALSCPSLNPPRLAAQLMAASGFSEAAANGNIAGMDAATWSKWRPAPAARITDRAAVIAALGHRTCETVGRLRAAGLTGDLWPAAIAAERAGFDAVVQAGGVPEGEKKQVDKVVAYSRWYADQPEFEVGGKPATVSPAAATPVPANLVSYVNAAGQICPAITPARVAAQLQALSGFNANLRSADGRVGVAQFTPQLWAAYQTRASASMWNPAEAIPALGVAMCRLNQELAGLGGDPYILALGAYQWGPNVVRQAGGLPRTTVTQLADRVVAQMPEYEKDKRLAVPAAKPTVTPKPLPSVTPSSAAPSKSSAPASTAPATPTTKPLYEPGKVYQLHNVHAGGAVIEVPGTDASKPSGTAVTLYTDAGGANQKWRIDKVEGDFVKLVNVHYGMALAVENASKDDGGKLVVEKPNAALMRQQWKLIDLGNGEIALYNRNSDKVADISGDDWGAPFADGTWNTVNVQQWSYQDYARDQRWNLR